jgi:hypothetical protein
MSEWDLRERARVLAETCLLDLPEESGAQLLHCTSRNVEVLRSVRRDTVDFICEALAGDFADDYGKARSETVIKFIRQMVRAEEGK